MNDTLNDLIDKYVGLKVRLMKVSTHVGYLTGVTEGRVAMLTIVIRDLRLLRLKENKI